MYDIERIKRLLKKEQIKAGTAQHIVELLEKDTQDIDVSRTLIYNKCLASINNYLELLFGSWRAAGKDVAPVPVVMRKGVEDAAKAAAASYVDYIIDIKENKND